MRWQELTPPRFAEAVKEVDGVCVLPIGSVETHGAHLPLGTDYLVVDAVAAQAAEIEPALVFPPYYFATGVGGTYQTGSVDYGYQVLFDLLTEIVAEISRNGLKKIVIAIGHGGYNGFIWDFLASQFEQERDYAVYVSPIANLYDCNRDPEWLRIRTSQTWGHACEPETSMVLRTYPELVHLEEHRGSGAPRKQLGHLEGIGIIGGGLFEYPDHYVGDARPATREKGDYLYNRAVRELAKVIAAAKADTKTAQYMKKYYQAAAQP